MKLHVLIKQVGIPFPHVRFGLLCVFFDAMVLPLNLNRWNRLRSQNSIMMIYDLHWPFFDCQVFLDVQIFVLDNYFM
jgi:hypothetical protein